MVAAAASLVEPQRVEAAGSVERQSAEAGASVEPQPAEAASSVELRRAEALAFAQLRWQEPGVSLQSRGAVASARPPLAVFVGPLLVQQGRSAREPLAGPAPSTVVQLSGRVRFASVGSGRFHHGRFNHGFRRPFVGTAFGLGLYGAYPYYYDDYYPYYAYDDYYENGCYVVKRRVYTRNGWRVSPVQVCV